MLTGLRASVMPADTLQLRPGTAYLLNTYGELQRVVIPMMTQAAMHAAGERLTTDKATPMTTEARPMGFQPPPRSHSVVIESPSNSHSAADDYTASQSPIVNSAEAVRVVALFLEGNDAAAIVTELTGMRSKDGKRYMEKLGEVQAIIRDALRRAKP